MLGDGKLLNPTVAKKAVEDGIFDYIGLGNQMLADPYWAKKVKTGHTEDITPCVGCNECLLAGFSGKHYYCAVNPLCYAEKEYALPKADGTVRKVLVIGGGLAGTESACDIAAHADKVTLLEMMPDILYTAQHCLNNDQHLRRLVKDRDVETIGNAKVTAISNNSVTYEKDGQTYVVACDTIINAVGFRPNNELEDLLEEMYEDVCVVGDAISPRKIMTAIHEGYHAIRVME